jgi:hypothetical protein
MSDSFVHDKLVVQAFDGVNCGTRTCVEDGRRGGVVWQELEAKVTNQNMLQKDHVLHVPYPL